MRGHRWLVVVGILALSACGESWWKERNCPDHSSCDDAGPPKPDTPQQCGNITCEAPLVCSPQQTCVECVTHDDCRDSKLCLEGGTCAAPGHVMYVRETPPWGMECTLELPCENVYNALFYQPLPKFKYIKVTGTISDDQDILIEAHPVSIYGASNARLQRSMDNGAILHVKGPNASASLYDLEITGQRGTGGLDHAIRVERVSGIPRLSLTRVKVFNNAGRGISADGGLITVIHSTFLNNTGGGIVLTGPGALVLSRSTLNLNSGGGVFLGGSADFDVINNIIFSNGLNSSAFGGVRIDTTSAGARRFEFNTVTLNRSMAAVAPGVSCSLSTAPLELRNSIVYDNGTGAQVDGTMCTWSYSDIGPTGVSGSTNINQLPLFVNPGAENFHLQLGSPAEDKAGPTTIDIDIDGDRRPPGGMPDMGADEIR